MLGKIKSIYFSCIHCLTPKIIYDPSLDPLIITTKCFLNHEIKYNINNYIMFRKEQFNHIENILCDKCKSKKNLSFCDEEKSLLCQKCFPKNHKDKNHTIHNLNKIDRCPKHNKDYFYCNICEIIYCPICHEEHKSHKFSPIKNYLLSERENIKMQFIVNKLEQINFDLNFKIFNSLSHTYNYTEMIYKYRCPEISLYLLLKEEYIRRYSKYHSFNVLFNIRNLILDKFDKIKEISFIDFINDTKTSEENNKNKELMINYLKKNYINFDHLSYNNENNISILKDENNKNINISYFLLLKKDNILTATDTSLFVYDKNMKYKTGITLQKTNDQTKINKEQIISYIHYKKYNKDENNEIIYAFITSKIYEITLTKEYILECKEYNCKRISYKIDGVIDMPNDDIITVCHMYPVICWRKNKEGNFYEYKLLTEQKPYIKNAINIIHLPDNEFAFTSHSWPSLKIYKYEEEQNNDYNLIYDIRLNCSSKKNTMTLYQGKILLIYIDREQIVLFNVKNKEIICKIDGINVSYIYTRKNGDIIIKENVNMFQFRPIINIINIYHIQNGEFLYKGVFENKLQIYIQEMHENEKGELFIIGYEHNFCVVDNCISKVYLVKNENI